MIKIHKKTKEENKKTKADFFLTIARHKFIKSLEERNKLIEINMSLNNDNKY